jgi:SAM-dependent methyltransferase
MMERALSFGSVAEQYERFRPSYPDRVFEVVNDYTGMPIGTALEIGAGTGKATRLFAAQGIEVTASDPDPAMLEELRRHVPDRVRTLRAAFEELDTETTFDLVYAAASLHWTDPAGRWERVAGWLRDDGVFASFGGPVELVDSDLAARVAAARAAYLDSDDVPSPDGTPAEAAMQWPGTELERSGLFRDVEQHVVERRWTASPVEYVGYLSTVSAYLVLPPDPRAQALERILEVLPAEVEINADVVVHLVRR